ncbi:single-stranded DNA-binding protein [Lysinibacillus agricola]|uniref:Single-stranded DNA-binding protein n=1 Tax=Lysinibacillus agricola TaxID=2590012 RepID=A0ABX7ALX0_9BACI|nr:MULTISPECIES: single-stranded DNA-binding protein [Lysinibacillus]KOS64653.1 single-stranded DNA-binding protein [Lysinibacillus sp. FJAT-14222]QQP10451.1 single-stranded DNA-binding protein [Lysinibacillus agricola]
MINRVVLVGRLTKDPELRYTPNGIASCRFTLAVNRTFTNEQGERDADFISCVAWRKQAENLANYQRKGNLLGIEGRIQTGSYEGQDGKRVYTTDVVADSIQFLEPRTNTGGQPNAPQYQGQPNPYQQQQPPQQYGGQAFGNNQPAYVGGQSQQHFGGTMPGQNAFGNNTYQQNQPLIIQPNYTRVDEDPFANSRGPIEVSEDDLPF